MSLRIGSTQAHKAELIAPLMDTSPKRGFCILCTSMLLSIRAVDWLAKANRTICDDRSRSMSVRSRRGRRTVSTPGRGRSVPATEAFQTLLKPNYGEPDCITDGFNGTRNQRGRAAMVEDWAGAEFSRRAYIEEHDDTFKVRITACLFRSRSLLGLCAFALNESISGVEVHLAGLGI